MGFSKYKKSPIFIILKWIHKNRAFEIAIQRNPIFFHPDFTVGTGITPVQPAMNHCEVVDFHHRSGISPCPEDESYLYFCYIQTISDTYALVKSDCNGFEIFFFRVLSDCFSQTARNGKRTKNVVPIPGSLWTSISPSCASTIVFTIESPIPVPFCFEYVRDLSFL